MWTHGALVFVAGLAYVQSGSVTQTMCPPLAVGFAFDESGSIAWTGPGKPGSHRRRRDAPLAKQKVKAFGHNMIDYLSSGPKAAESLVCGVGFSNGARILWACTNVFSSAKSSLNNYKIGGGTNMGSGCVKVQTQLAGVKQTHQNLARVMLMISDGEPNPSSQKSLAISTANAMKQDDVTVISVGFDGASGSVLDQMAGSKNYNYNDPECKMNGQNWCSMVTADLATLESKLATGFCKTIIVITPPTPSPPPPACPNNNKADTSANKDLTWSTCAGGLCNNYPWGNGSNQACVYLRDVENECAQFLHHCRCTCFRCCDTPAPTSAPTPHPTPAPGEPTSSPTPSPTEAPTLQLPTNPAFVFDFQYLSDWEKAKQILQVWFQQLGYDFDMEWGKMINEGRVKVVKNGASGKFHLGNILTVPFEPFQMQVWMPDKFYQTTTILGANRIASALVAFLALFITAMRV